MKRMVLVQAGTGGVHLTRTQRNQQGVWDTLRATLFAPVDVTSLVYFRIAFGAIMLWEVWRYFDQGRIERYYIEPEFYFTYFGFDWVRPWPGDGMYLHFYALGALSICIMLGLRYRLSMALFFLGFTYVFLLDKTQYLNHFYLISLLSFLLIFVPAHRAFSLDSRLRPALRSQNAPAWTLWMLRTQIGLVYFFGGVAKLNGDWLHGQPMRLWLAERTDFPLIGTWFTEDWIVYLFSYGGLLFDLLIIPLLLWRRTRLLALIVGFAFHLTNAKLFNIGIFPWFMMAATLLFLPPHWPRCLLQRPAPAITESFEVPLRPRTSQRLIIAALALYFGWQLVMPLRHFLYPGDVSWTEEGHLFSWHMRLRDKNGFARFYVTDPQTETSWEIQPLDYLTERQFEQMVTQPDMILQFSHYIADELRAQGHAQIEVRVWTHVSLNGRRPQVMIDTTVDLAAQSFSLLAATWIMPLDEPLLEADANGSN